MPGGRKPRSKGIRFEREVVSVLREYNIRAKRVPLSGSTDFQKGDIVIETVEGNPIVVELKSRKNEFTKVYQLFTEATSRGMHGLEMFFYEPKTKKQLFGPMYIFSLEKWLEMMTNFGKIMQVELEVVDLDVGWQSIAKKFQEYTRNVDMIMIKDDRKPILVGITDGKLFDVLYRTIAIEGLTVDKDSKDDAEE